MIKCSLFSIHPLEKNRYCFDIIANESLIMWQKCPNLLSCWCQIHTPLAHTCYSPVILVPFRRWKSADSPRINFRTQHLCRRALGQRSGSGRERDNKNKRQQFEFQIEENFEREKDKREAEEGTSILKFQAEPNQLTRKLKCSCPCECIWDYTGKNSVYYQNKWRTIFPVTKNSSRKTRNYCKNKEKFSKIRPKSLDMKSI